jgi:putative endonuclease
MDRARKMYYLYILKNEETDRYYIGSTTNIERRLKQHLAGHTRTSRILGTNTLVYKETFNTISEARGREKKLKSYKAKNILNG